MAKVSEYETSAKSILVILSEAKDLVFSKSYEILQSLCSLRMTVLRTFAEVSTWHNARSILDGIGDVEVQGAGAGFGVLRFPAN